MSRRRPPSGSSRTGAEVGRLKKIVGSSSARACPGRSRPSNWTPPDAVRAQQVALAQSTETAPLSPTTSVGEVLVRGHVTGADLALVVGTPAADAAGRQHGAGHVVAGACRDGRSRGRRRRLRPPMTRRVAPPRRTSHRCRHREAEASSSPHATQGKGSARKRASDRAGPCAGVTMLPFRADAALRDSEAAASSKRARARAQVEPGWGRPATDDRTRTGGEHRAQPQRETGRRLVRPLPATTANIQRPSLRWASASRATTLLSRLQECQ